MKKLVLMSMIIPVVFVLGIVLDAVGYGIGNLTMARVGIAILSYGLPVTMFVLVVVGLILMMTGRLSDKKPTKKSDVTFGEAEEEETIEKAEAPEEDKIEEINSSYGYDSQRKLAEYQIDHVANAYRHSGRGDRIKGWLFFGFLMGDFALIFLFGFLGIMTGVIVCLAIFAGTILLSLIVKIILEKTSMSRRVNTDKYEQRQATVKATVLSSMGSTGGGSRHSTVHVHSVTYRVILDVDGREYQAYSRETYEAGEKVDVWVRKSGGGVAKIIESSPEKESD